MKRLRIFALSAVLLFVLSGGGCSESRRPEAASPKPTPTPKPARRMPGYYPTSEAPRTPPAPRPEPEQVVISFSDEEVEELQSRVEAEAPAPQIAQPQPPLDGFDRGNPRPPAGAPRRELSPEELREFRKQEKENQEQQKFFDRGMEDAREAVSLMTRKLVQASKRHFDKSATPPRYHEGIAPQQPTNMEYLGRLTVNEGSEADPCLNPMFAEIALEGLWKAVPGAKIFLYDENKSFRGTMSENPRDPLSVFNQQSAYYKRHVYMPAKTFDSTPMNEKTKGWDIYAQF